MSYLEVTRGISDVARYTPLLSEWDLNKALEQASDPYLFLKINVEPLSNTNLRCDGNYRTEFKLCCSSR